MANRVDEVRRIVSEMTLDELNEFVSLFHVPLTVHQLNEAIIPAPVFVDVMLESVSDKVIQTIKVVRVHSGLGLKEAKDLVDRVRGKVFADYGFGKVEYSGGKPEIFLRNVSRESAYAAVNELAAVGAIARVL